MTRTKKLWGENEVLHSTPAVKICRLHILPGGFCSWHYHGAKDNTFIVEEGSLTIEVENEGGGSILRRPGAQCTVPAGVRHRFVNYSTTPAQVLEVESLSLLSDGDIHRTDEGGLLYGEAR